MNICSALLSPRDSDGACLHILQAAKMEKIYLYLKQLKVALFLLMQKLLAVCVEITVYNKGFMTRRQRSRSPSWPHWQCRTVKPFYGGDKKLPVSQLEVSGKKNQLNFNAPISHYHWTNPYHCSQHNSMNTTVSSLSSKTFVSWHNNRFISFTWTIVMKITSWWPFDLNSKNQIINRKITISQIVVTKRRSWWLGDLINGARQ